MAADNGVGNLLIESETVEFKPLAISRLRPFNVRVV
jgi:hypothetical protein